MILVNPFQLRRFPDSVILWPCSTGPEVESVSGWKETAVPGGSWRCGSGVSSFPRLTYQTLFFLSYLEVKRASKNSAAAKTHWLLKR